MKNKFLKLTSIIIAVIFLWDSLAWAAPGVPNVLARADLSTNLYISEQYGRIEQMSDDRHQMSDKMVVLIKDAHCHYEAQRNIKSILSYLIKEYKVRMICLEGAEGVINTSPFDSYPDSSIRRKVSDRFLKEGKLTAAEALAISEGGNPGFSMYGLEDTALYLKNMKLFRGAMLEAEYGRSFGDELMYIVNKLKTVIYPKELRQFDRYMTDCKENRLSLVKYINMLNFYREKIHLSNTIPFENIYLVLRSGKIEDKINFGEVERERMSLIRALEKIMVKEELEGLVKKSLLFKLGKISSGEFYTYLEDCIAKYKVYNLPGLSNLKKYIRLVQLQAQIDADGLFNEIENTEDVIGFSLCNNDIQRQLWEINRIAGVISKLFSLRLSRDEFNYFSSKQEKFKPEKLCQRLKILAGIAGVKFPQGIENAAQEVLPYLENAVGFYRLAVKRDRVLVKNLIEEMARENEDTAVIIVGGFHSEGIIDQLQKEGVSYVVISPKITEKGDNNKYLSLMLDERIDIDKAMAGISANTLSSILTTSKLGGELLGFLRRELASAEVETGRLTLAELIRRNRKLTEEQERNLEELFEMAGLKGFYEEKAVGEIGELDTEEAASVLIEILEGLDGNRERKETYVETLNLLLAQCPEFEAEPKDEDKGPPTIPQAPSPEIEEEEAEEEAPVAPTEVETIEFEEGAFESPMVKRIKRIFFDIKTSVQERTGFWTIGLTVIWLAMILLPISRGYSSGNWDITITTGYSSVVLVTVLAAFFILLVYYGASKKRERGEGFREIEENKSLLIRILTHPAFIFAVISLLLLVNMYFYEGITGADMELFNPEVYSGLFAGFKSWFSGLSISAQKWIRYFVIGKVNDILAVPFVVSAFLTVVRVFNKKMYRFITSSVFYPMLVLGSANAFFYTEFDGARIVGGAQTGWMISDMSDIYAYMIVSGIMLVPFMIKKIRGVIKKAREKGTNLVEVLDDFAKGSNKERFISLFTIGIPLIISTMYLYRYPFFHKFYQLFLNWPLIAGLVLAIPVMVAVRRYILSKLEARESHRKASFSDTPATFISQYFGINMIAFSSIALFLRYSFGMQVQGLSGIHGLSGVALVLMLVFTGLIMFFYKKAKINKEEGDDGEGSQIQGFIKKVVPGISIGGFGALLFYNWHKSILVDGEIRSGLARWYYNNVGEMLHYAQSDLGIIITFGVFIVLTVASIVIISQILKMRKSIYEVDTEVGRGLTLAPALPPPRRLSSKTRLGESAVEGEVAYSLLDWLRDKDMVSCEFIDNQKVMVIDIGQEDDLSRWGYKKDGVQYKVEAHGITELSLIWNDERGNRGTIHIQALRDPEGEIYIRKGIREGLIIDTNARRQLVLHEWVEEEFQRYCSAEVPISKESYTLFLDAVISRFSDVWAEEEKEEFRKVLSYENFMAYYEDFEAGNISDNLAELSEKIDTLLFGSMRDELEKPVQDLTLKDIDKMVPISDLDWRICCINLRHELKDRPDVDEEELPFPQNTLREDSFWKKYRGLILFSGWILAMGLLTLGFGDFSSAHGIFNLLGILLFPTVFFSISLFGHYFRKAKTQQEIYKEKFWKHPAFILAVIIGLLIINQYIFNGFALYNAGFQGLIGGGFNGWFDLSNNAYLFQPLFHIFDWLKEAIPSLFTFASWLAGLSLFRVNAFLELPFAVFLLLTVMRALNKKLYFFTKRSLFYPSLVIFSSLVLIFVELAFGTPFMTSSIAARVLIAGLMVGGYVYGRLKEKHPVPDFRSVAEKKFTGTNLLLAMPIIGGLASLAMMVYDGTLLYNFSHLISNYIEFLLMLGGTLGLIGLKPVLEEAGNKLEKKLKMPALSDAVDYMGTFGSVFALIFAIPSLGIRYNLADFTGISSSLIIYAAALLFLSPLVRFIFKGGKDKIHFAYDYIKGFISSISAIIFLPLVLIFFTFHSIEMAFLSILLFGSIIFFFTFALMNKIQKSLRGDRRVKHKKKFRSSSKTRLGESAVEGEAAYSLLDWLRDKGMVSRESIGNHKFMLLDIGPEDDLSGWIYEKDGIQYKVEVHGITELSLIWEDEKGNRGTIHIQALRDEDGEIYIRKGVRGGLFTDPGAMRQLILHEVVEEEFQKHCGGEVTISDESYSLFLDAVISRFTDVWTEEEKEEFRKVMSYENFRSYYGDLDAGSISDNLAELAEKIDTLLFGSMREGLERPVNDLTLEDIDAMVPISDLDWRIFYINLNHELEGRPIESEQSLREVFCRVKGLVLADVIDIVKDKDGLERFLSLLEEYADACDRAGREAGLGVSPEIKQGKVNIAIDSAVRLFRKIKEQESGSDILGAELTHKVREKMKELGYPLEDQITIFNLIKELRGQLIGTEIGPDGREKIVVRPFARLMAHELEHELGLENDQIYQVLVRGIFFDQISEELKLDGIVHLREQVLNGKLDLGDEVLRELRRKAVGPEILSSPVIGLFTDELESVLFIRALDILERLAEYHPPGLIEAPLEEVYVADQEVMERIDQLVIRASARGWDIVREEPGAPYILKESSVETDLGDVVANYSSPLWRGLVLGSGLKKVIAPLSGIKEWILFRRDVLKNSFANSFLWNKVQDECEIADEAVDVCILDFESCFEIVTEDSEIGRHATIKVKGPDARDILVKAAGMERVEIMGLDPGLIAEYGEDILYILRNEFGLGNISKVNTQTIRTGTLQEICESVSKEYGLGRDAKILFVISDKNEDKIEPARKGEYKTIIANHNVPISYTIGFAVLVSGVDENNIGEYKDRIKSYLDIIGIELNDGEFGDFISEIARSGFCLFKLPDPQPIIKDRLFQLQNTRITIAISV